MKYAVNILRTCVGQGFSKHIIRMAHRWGYTQCELPPGEWHKDYPIANGQRQSPINLDPASAKAESFPAFSLKYQLRDITSVSNNGHSVTFHVGDGNSQLSGGPLKDKFKLAQFHFHWGADSSKGSEHLLAGKSYAAELHLVHWNADKYESFAESLNHPDGLCVLGALLETSDRDNQSYRTVIDYVKSVPTKGTEKPVTDELCAKSLLPGDLGQYFHYPGSLTTPPLSECVQWVVFKQPVQLSENQLAAFRALHTGDDAKSACLCDNFRPVQPLHDRKVCST